MLNVTTSISCPSIKPVECNKIYQQEQQVLCCVVCSPEQDLSARTTGVVLCAHLNKIQQLFTFIVSVEPMTCLPKSYTGVSFDKTKTNPEKWLAGLGLPLV